MNGSEPLADLVEQTFDQTAPLGIVNRIDFVLLPQTLQLTHAMQKRAWKP